MNNFDNVQVGSLITVVLTGFVEKVNSDIMTISNSRGCDYEFCPDEVDSVITIKNPIPENYFVFWNNDCYSVDRFNTNYDERDIHLAQIVGRLEENQFIFCDRVVSDDEDGLKKDPCAWE